MTSNGVLIIEARRYRTQEQNRSDAIQRLTTLLHKASQAPVIRHATHPTRASQAHRIDSKRKHSQLKRTRRAGKSDNF